MNVAVMSFSKRGRQLSGRVAGCLRREGHTVTEAVKSAAMPDSIAETLPEWTGEQFGCRDVMVFIGAAAIAVRAIAPHVRNKAEDPAVLVLDERGRYCIPILSGHIGGANELALFLEKEIEAAAVVTTATDIYGKWAVDVFAKKNRLVIGSMSGAKRIAARLLEGEEITLYVEGKGTVGGSLPGHLRLMGDEEVQKEMPDICIGIYAHPEWKGTLQLIPKAVAAGVGCRKGIDAKKVESAVCQALSQEGILPESLGRVASIDRKAEEEGILSYCKEKGLEYVTYPAGELGKAEGTFYSSDFVREIMGVDNVCERSAVCAAGNGELIAGKRAQDGVTVALALGEWGVNFE